MNLLKGAEITGKVVSSQKFKILDIKVAFSRCHVFMAYVYM